MAAVVRVAWVLCAFVLVGVVPAFSAPIGLPALVRAVQLTGELWDYPVYGPDGAALGTARWRVVNGTGNHAENYLASNHLGELFNLGGGSLWATGDKGETWQRIDPLVPLVRAEGAVDVTPAGEAIGVAWDPYTGDRLVAYRFVAETGQWLYTEQPLRVPFYDRPWLGVLPGPFSLGDDDVPFLATLIGGLGPGESRYPPRDFVFHSDDGLVYSGVTQRRLAYALDPGEIGDIPLAPSAALDWMQPAYLQPDLFVRPGFEAIAPLGAGWGVASFSRGYQDLDGTEPCASLILQPSVRWVCSNTAAPWDASAILRLDSAGRLHSISRACTEYMMSEDGGQSWISVFQFSGALGLGARACDARTNGRLDMTAMSIHTRQDGSNLDQTLVVKITNVSRPDRGIRYFMVGARDVRFNEEVQVPQANLEYRLDFPSVAILPDGSVAATLMDRRHPQAALAIEL